MSFWHDELRERREKVIVELGAWLVIGLASSAVGWLIYSCLTER